MDLPVPGRSRKAKKSRLTASGEAPASQPAADRGLAGSRRDEVVDAEVVEDAPAPARPQAADGAPAEVVEEIEPQASELEELDPAEVDEELKSKTLARKDPLSAYMAEVTKHPLLTREEEIELARKYRDTADVRAAYKLVASNLRLVVKLAHEYHRNPLALLDLIQEGNIGLMQAVKKFDPERGVKLSSYAAWWIRAYILRFIMDNWKLVKLGTTEAQRKLFFKLRQEQDRLQAQGFEVTPKLLAERLNVTEQDVVEMDQRLSHDELSLDAPMRADDDDKATRADRLVPSGQTAVDETLGNEELKATFRQHLDEFAKTLNEKEKYIFEKRLISDEPQTLQDIGAHFGVSRERARQIEAALIERMKRHMRAKIPDFDLVAEADRD